MHRNFDVGNSIEQFLRHTHFATFQNAGGKSFFFLQGAVYPKTPTNEEKHFIFLLNQEKATENRLAIFFLQKRQCLGLISSSSTPSK